MHKIQERWVLERILRRCQLKYTPWAKQQTDETSPCKRLSFTSLLRNELYSVLAVEKVENDRVWNVDKKIVYNRNYFTCLTFTSTRQNGNRTLFAGASCSPSATILILIKSQDSLFVTHISTLFALLIMRKLGVYCLKTVVKARHSNTLYTNL